MGKRGGKVRVKQVGAKGPKMVNPMEDLMTPPEEMINLPPPPDRSFQLFWPISQTFSMDPAGFQCIYPSYLDSTKTTSKGRRIGGDKAVPNPTVSDISQVLQTLNIRHVLQPNKGYSRDIETLWDNPGRVLYEPPTDTCYNTKRKLLLEVASKIEALPARIQRLEQEAIQAEMERKKEEEAALRERQAQKQQKQLQAQQSAKSGKSNKKKGKKKR
ncbi:MAG: hypothetical protein SGBAC_005695 [Bacillariaceae sp.]